MTARAPDLDLEPLVVRAATGDEDAWQAMWHTVEPMLARFIARPGFLARLGAQPDDRRNLIVLIMARLREDQFRRLGMYVASRQANPQLTFATWLRVVAKRVGIDYLRGHPDYVARRSGDGDVAGDWIAPEPMPPSSQLGTRPPWTDLGTARELARHADELPTQQQEALAQWLGGADHAAIARALELPDALAAERLVRAALERLRRRVREDRR